MPSRTWRELRQGRPRRGAGAVGWGISACTSCQCLLVRSMGPSPMIYETRSLTGFRWSGFHPCVGKKTASTWAYTNLDITELFFDEQNPRIPLPPEGADQDRIRELLIKTRKFFELPRSIVAHDGLVQGEQMIAFRGDQG